jgi:hypothetical protein
VLCAPAFGQARSTRPCRTTRCMSFSIELSPKGGGGDRRGLVESTSNGCHDRAGAKRSRRGGVGGRGEQSLPLLPSGIENRRGWSSLTSLLPARPVGCVLGICACPVCVPSPEDTGRPASRRTGGVCFFLFGYRAIVGESTGQTMTTVNLSWFIAGEQAGARRWSSS